MKFQYKLSSRAYALGLYSKGLIAATNDSAGIELFAAIDKPITLYPDRIYEAIKTGLHIEGYGDGIIRIASFLMPKSSTKIGFKNAVGLIDPDYQGELIIKAASNGNDIVTINPGQPIAQLVLMPVLIPSEQEFTLVSEFNSNTERGNNGFGGATKTKFG